MLIGELAERAGRAPARCATTRRTGWSVRTFRQRLPRLRRGGAAGRTGDPRAADVGFGLDDVRPFVACLRAGNTSGDVCPDSVLVLRRKLAEVDDYIDRLGAVRRQLQDQLTHAIAHREETCPRTRQPPR